MFYHLTQGFPPPFQENQAHPVVVRVGKVPLGATAASPRAGHGAVSLLILVNLSTCLKEERGVEVINQLEVIKHHPWPPCCGAFWSLGWLGVLWLQDVKDFFRESPRGGAKWPRRKMGSSRRTTGGM